MAKWLLKTAVRGSPVGRLLDVADAALWLYNHKADIEAFFDPAKPLDELRAAARDPRPGYDVHHINERAAARLAGLTDYRIFDPSNEVLVPRYRHWDVTASYMRKLDRLGNISLRDYLRDKSWEDRFRFGIEALIDNGVLKP